MKDTECVAMQVVRELGWLAVMWLTLATPSFGQWSAADYNARLGAGVNLGNALEAPQEGEWGNRLEAWQFQEIAKAGFDSVRVPIRWSAHASTDAPYTIDVPFWERVDWVVRQAEQHDLALIINVHHYDELQADPAAHSDRFIELWRQISTRYQANSDNVYFELLNEPHDKLGGTTWNELFAKTLAVVRSTNPLRPIIVGGEQWNSVQGLEQLHVPADDRNLILTFHYYSPFQFTHQGASWVTDSDKWLGKTWQNDADSQRAVRDDFDRVQQVAKKLDLPVLLGEYGAYSAADTDSRVRWMRFVSEQAAQRKFSRAYWEFCEGFGLYDREKKTWRLPLYEALAPRSVFDLNGDRLVDRADFTLLAQLVARYDPAADLNADGIVNNRDTRFWTYFAGRRVGDFSQDGKWQADDIDVLAAAIREKTTDLRFDLNQDGVIDTQDHKYWVEQIANTYYGDTNLDGQFAPNDLIIAYQRAEFEDGVFSNSTWAEGDWNGDGEFDSADIVEAMATGAFEKGPRAGKAGTR